MAKIAIVTGGSGGIGRCTAAALHKAGCTVYEFSRHDAGTEGVAHVQCDVSDERQFAAAVRQVHEAEGRIDILVNNAGFGISGAAEFTDNAQAKKLLDVNLFGMVNGCRAVLPAMRVMTRDCESPGRVYSRSMAAAAPKAADTPGHDSYVIPSLSRASICSRTAP